MKTRHRQTNVDMGGGGRTLINDLKDWAEIAKNIIEALAFVVAGVWTYKVFVQKEAPALERHASNGGTFEWTNINDDTCEGSFYPTLKNDGVSSFDVAKVRVRLWVFPIPPSTEGGQSFVSQPAIEAAQPAFERTFTDGAFVRRYPPGEHRSERYSWFFEKAPARNVLVRADFFASVDDNSPEWSQYYWRSVCSEK